ncbi:SDR family NAD(P)-dependent oxidoreductase [Neoactinobaculum massilliense]|uniref:SDR family NAD(P)-dependent oxidoreductase n=1 Tax=Neoactinobaculum massilliense TaxID=2364794 RepID=UPI000F52DA61|nr:SDR family NAD(P)-dependent oxidoreductase [Neoactinobaculum massilliense]
MVFDFTGKTAIVTGGSGGIGSEIARGIVAGGGHVIVTDIDDAKGEAFVKTLGKGNSYYHLDIGTPNEARATVTQILVDHPETNTLINVAGVISAKPFEEIDDAEWSRTITINLNGTFTMCSALFPHLKKIGGGRIVNVSSVAGKIGGGLLGTAAYASSKAGVNGLTKAVAKEGGKYGIACNAVCPSFTLTQMTTALNEDKTKHDKVIAMIPLGRAAQPSEPAQMVLFFASDAASFVTGEIGDCDGGIVMDG